MPPKREPTATEPGESSSPPRQRHRGESSSSADEPGVTERRFLRNRYLAVKSQIYDERDDLSKVDSDKFGSIIKEVESLHERVRNPREQVADAEALLDITSTLVTSVKSHANDGVSPSDFTTALLSNFGLDRGSNADSARNTFSWSDAGLAISHAFREFPGSLTMVGPMESEMKQRKAAVHRKRTRPSESTCPEELENQQEVKTDTDKNMSTMFDVLRKKKRVRLENLVLNRASFAQSVENIFALSFLVKDGRAEISVNESGHHFVSPRNAPTATSVASGNVSFNHFVFRFDFKDWKLMMSTVDPGEELIPHRSISTTAEPTLDNSESGAPSTPIRKLSRNRGLVTQEQNVVDDTPERETSDRGKGKIF